MQQLHLVLVTTDASLHYLLAIQLKQSSMQALPILILYLDQCNLINAL